MDTWLSDRDLFELYRVLLGTVCGIYAVVVTGRSIGEWIVYLSHPDRQTQLLRHYVIVQMLRLRWRRFAWDFVSIGFYLVCLAVLMYGHRFI